jgi:hypothetical protein
MNMNNFDDLGTKLSTEERLLDNSNLNFVGLKFTGNPSTMIEICCQVLIDFNCEWEFINKKSMKLKCRT